MPSNAPAASPKVASTIGLKDLVIAPLVTDTAQTLEYGTLQKVAGAIEASITPGNADAEVQYADDIEFAVLFPEPEISLKTKMADIPLAIQESIFGNKLDGNGVLIRSSTDTPPYYAIGFRSEKSDHTYRYVWLYKCRAKPVTETYSTKEGTSVTRQTGEVEWVAIKRVYDGRYQAIADEGQNGFNAEAAATFLSSVYMPDRKSTRLNSSHPTTSRMPSSA